MALGVAKPVMVTSSLVRPACCAASSWPGRAVESLQMIRSMSAWAASTALPMVTDFSASCSE